MRAMGMRTALAFFCALGSVVPLAMATDSGDVVHGMTVNQAKDQKTQYAVAESLSSHARDGLSVTTAKVLISQSSDGTFLPKVVEVSNLAAANPTNVGLAKMAKNFDAIFTANSVGGSTVTGTQIENALTVATGVAYTGANNVADATVGAIGGAGGAIPTHMAALRDTAQAGPATVGSFGANASLGVYNNMVGGTANRIWASPFYVHQNMGDKDGFAGYKYKAGGLSLGYDRAFGSNVVVGAAFTFSHGDYSRKHADDDNTIKSFGVSGYAQFYSCSGFFASIAGGYNYGHNKWNERILNQSQSGKNHTNSYWLGGALGYDFRAGSKVIVTPTVGLFWSESKGSEYRSTGAFDMTVGKMTSKSLLLPVDVTVQYKHEINDCSSVTLKVGGGYSYNFKNDGARGQITYDYIGGAPVLVNGMVPGRHSWNATTGIKYQYKNMDIGVDYRYDGKKKFNAHRVSATVGLNF